MNYHLDCHLHACQSAPCPLGARWAVDGPGRPDPAHIADVPSIECAGLLWQQLMGTRAPQSLADLFPGFAAWSACMEQGQPVPLIAANRGSELVALLPVSPTQRRVRGISLRVLGSAGGDHWKASSPVLGADPEQGILALLHAFRHRDGWDMLELGPMLVGCDASNLLFLHGRRLGYWPQVADTLYDPAVDLRGSWVTYYGKLSGNLRSQVKRGEAKLAREGTVTFHEYRGGPDLAERLAEFYHVEASGWKGREGTAIAADPRIRQFYTLLAQDAARQGALRLYFLRVGDHCVAADYCLAHGGTVSMLKVSYDEQWAHCSPGQVMRKRVLDHLFAAGEDDIYDMLPGGGDHRAYKLRWSNVVRDCVIIRLFNPRTLRGRLAAAASRFRAWLRAGRTPVAQAEPARAQVSQH